MHPLFLSLLVALSSFWTVTQAAAIPTGVEPDNGLPFNISALAKRYYSLPPLHELVFEFEGTRGPWPRDCKGRNAVRYCFADQTSYKRLNRVMNAAIARWAFAFYQSALSIELHENCPPDTEVCICDRDRHSDALWIKDISTSEDGKDTSPPDCGSRSTLGYTYVAEDDDRPQWRGRHELQFCDLRKGMIPIQVDRAVLAMTHELGHAIGLHHEHQRPDRDDFIVFHPATLRGYPQAKADLAAMGTDIDPLVNDVEAMIRFIVAGKGDQASANVKSFLDTCSQYLKFILHSRPEEAAFLRSLQYGQEFDYDSVMIYSSVPWPFQDDVQKRIFSRKDNGGPIFQGGNDDVYRAGPTWHDVDRIAQMYPTYGNDPAIAVKPPKDQPIPGWLFPNDPIHGVTQAIEEPHKRDVQQLHELLYVLNARKDLGNTFHQPQRNSTDGQPQPGFDGSHPGKRDVDRIDHPLRIKIRNVFEGTVYPPGWDWQPGQRQPGVSGNKKPTPNEGEG